MITRHSRTTTEKTVGILAYGSLIHDPRDEITSATVETKKDILTPFTVEFARSSGTRGGAPTLVPVENGGAKVAGQVFIVNVDEDEAANRLWRRETNKVSSGRIYHPPKTISNKTVVVQRIEDFEGVGIVLYTYIAANIAPLTPENLAQLAVESVAKADRGKDGISYLMAAKGNGIRTALSDRYEEEILRRMSVSSLELALERARKKQSV